MISACAKVETKNNRFVQSAGVCTHSINGEWISRSNSDHLTLNADCTGKLLACQQTFYYQNPGTNNQTAVYINNSGLFAQCAAPGEYYCLVDNTTDPDVLAFQCNNGDLFIYDRMVQ
jgi:hypothetical protein